MSWGSYQKGEDQFPDWILYLINFSEVPLHFLGLLVLNLGFFLNVLESLLYVLLMTLPILMELDALEL